MSDQEPKIIVDEDWKEQVAKEKAAAAAAETASKDDASPDVAAEADDPASIKPSAEAAADDSADATPPPASVETLVSMLFTQAMAALGQFPDPSTGKPGPINKPYAKHFIDTLDVLQEKTQGNLSDDEAKMISEALHAMRMGFVSVKG